MQHELGTRTARGALIAVLLLAAGCQPAVNLAGQLPEAELLAQIQPGVSSREDVRTVLGSPSSVGTFDDTTWYYISRRTEQLAFYEPKVLDQTVIAVQFDAKGKVADLTRLGLKEGRDLELVERVTPTRGKKLGFFEQVFGNIGRFTEKGPQQGGGR